MVIARDRTITVQYQYALGERMYLVNVKSGRVFGCFKVIFPRLCSFMISSRIFCLGTACLDWTRLMSCSTVSGSFSFTVCIMYRFIVDDLECFLDKVLVLLRIVENLGL